jgi:hypothetical protein
VRRSRAPAQIVAARAACAHDEPSNGRDRGPSRLEAVGGIAGTVSGIGQAFWQRPQDFGGVAASTVSCVVLSAYVWFAFDPRRETTSFGVWVRIRSATRNDVLTRDDVKRRPDARGEATRRTHPPSSRAHTRSELAERP